MHSACATLAYAAPVLGAGKLHMIADHPEQRRLGIAVKIDTGIVYLELNHEVVLVQSEVGVGKL